MIGRREVLSYCGFLIVIGVISYQISHSSRVSRKPPVVTEVAGISYACLLSEVAGQCEVDFPIPRSKNCPIQLEVVSVSCGCAGVLACGKARVSGEKWFVALNESADIRVLTKIGMRAARRSITVRLRLQEEANVSELVCNASINALADLVIDPPALTFLVGIHFEPGATKKVRVSRTFRGKGNSPLPKVVLPEGFKVESSRLIHVENIDEGSRDRDLPQLLSETWEYRIFCGISEVEQAESFRAYVESVSPNGISSVEPLPINVRRASGIYGPRVVSMGDIIAGAEYKRRLVLLAADGVPFSVDDISITGNASHVTLPLPCAMALRQQVLEFVLVGRECGSFEEQIAVRTTHPAMPVFTFSCSGTIVKDGAVP
ncbi:MAG: hypothetical protein AB7O62_06665 [Pirellulales bacterium]